jgi:NDP-mannose synthase
MKAIILAGGKGTRLKPYTYVLPKPLVPVGERPILAYLIDSLREAGFTDLTLCVNHMAELVMAYFGNGSRFGVSITYSMEHEPLGTVAPLRLIADLPESFLVLNGDLLTDFDFRRFFDYHVKQGAGLTVATFRRSLNIDFGVLETDGVRALGFREKPDLELEVSMGIYGFRRDVLSFIPASGPFGFDQLMRTLLEKRQAVAVSRHGGYWLDIGRPPDFEKANEDIGRLTGKKETTT